MYKAMGDESAFRDGVFSHAAPRQGYQAGGGQFADGSLGAFSRSASTRGRHGGQRAPRMQPRSMTGIGATAFRDGSLGHAWRDGSLGADSATIQIGPNGASIGPTEAPVTVPVYQKPAFLIGAGMLAVLVTYFVMKR